MNIVMFTNVFVPRVGGVSLSVQRFTKGYRDKGHRVLVVAPEWDDQPDAEKGVVRVPAFKNLTDGNFSLALPWRAGVESALRQFDPDIIHSHHPYVLGDLAARLAADHRVPLVYTYHTNYEHYAHYVVEDSKIMRRFIVELATGYCEQADQIIAPSRSILAILRERGVTSPIADIPTGVDLEEYAHGDGAAFREAQGLPPEAFLCGIVSRLAPEKNPAFLTRAVSTYLQRDENAHFAVVGYGPSADTMRAVAERNNVADRVHFVGKTVGQDLVNAYHALDAFVFASQSETQGMVLVEALAAGTPLVALDAPGTREVVQDGKNGRLIGQKDEEAFADAIAWVARQAGVDACPLAERASQSAEPFHTERCVERVLALYEDVLRRARKESANGAERTGPFRQLNRDRAVWGNRIHALTEAIQKEQLEYEDIS